MLGSLPLPCPNNGLEHIIVTHCYSVIRQAEEIFCAAHKKTVANNLFAVQHNSMIEHMTAQIH